MEKFYLGDDSGKFVYICLFKDVLNIEELRASLLAGSLDAVMMKPRMITDIFTVLQAVHRAVYADKQGKLKTKSVNTEILYNLSPSTKISESLKSFGVHDADKELLLAHVANSIEDGKKEMVNICNMVEGVSVPLKELSTLTDECMVKKTYKVTDEELTIGTLSDAVVNRIAVKGSV